MLTKYKDKFNKVISCFTKPLRNGILIILNDDANTTTYIPNKTEKDYHIKLRRDIIKNNGEIITGSVIKDYKGRYKINNFIRK